MTAEIFRLWDYRKPEEASACETRLFMLELRKKDTPYPIGEEPTVYVAEDDVQTLADMHLEGLAIVVQAIDTSPSEMIPYHGQGIDGMQTDSGDCA